MTVSGSTCVLLHTHLVHATNSKLSVLVGVERLATMTDMQLYEMSNPLDALDFSFFHIHSCCMPMRHFVIETTTNPISGF
jgi:hypothetical protein